MSDYRVLDERSLAPESLSTGSRMEGMCGIGKVMVVNLRPDEE